VRAPARPTNSLRSRGQQPRGSHRRRSPRTNAAGRTALVAVNSVSPSRYRAAKRACRESLTAGCRRASAGRRACGAVGRPARSPPVVVALAEQQGGAGPAGRPTVPRAARRPARRATGAAGSVVRRRRRRAELGPRPLLVPERPPARRHPGRLLPLRLLHPRLSLARPTWPTRSPLGTLIGFRRPKPSEVALQLHQVALVRGPCPPGTRPAAVLAPPLGLLAGRFVMLALPLGPRTVPKSPDRALTAAHRASSYSPLRPSFHFKPFRRIRARPEFAASRRDPGAPAP
jgi:hypothetical protein